MRTAEFPGDGKGRRIELNAIAPRQFVQWVEDKLEAHGCKKVRPPDAVVNARLGEFRENAVRNATQHALMEFMGDDIMRDVLIELGLPEHDLDATLAKRPEQNWEYFLSQAAGKGDIRGAVSRALAKRRAE